MADGLEEPQMPDLNAGMNLGRTMVNAFLSAASVNRQRQALEEKIRESQLRMSMQEQKHDLDIEKLDWQHQFQSANLQRQYDAMHQSAVFADRRAQDTEDKANWYMSRKDAAMQNSGLLRDELSGLIQKYPDTYGNQEFSNELALIKSKYHTVTGTQEGSRVMSDFDRDITNAQRQAHQSADLLRKNFDSTLQITGSTVGRNDFLQPDAVWQSGKDPAGNPTRFLAKVAEPSDIPGGPARWRTVDRKEELQLLKQGKKPRYDSLDSRAYDSLRKMHDAMLKIGGTNPNEKPTGVLNSTETTRNVGSRKAIFDSSSKQFIRWADE